MSRRGAVRSAVAALALVAALFPATAAHAQVAIEFLNPSDYSPTMQLSDVGDSDAAFHLVAWVKSVPASPLVEFELQATGENPQTINAARVGSTDTWEAFFQIPDDSTDGPYVLRARLYSGATEVANDQIGTVTVNQSDVPPPPAAETVEITYPANGSPFGFFTPKGKATNGVIVTKSSPGTRQVRAFYTQSDPGTDPEWRACGFATPAGGVARIRCTLASGHAPSSVTAVAAVANRTPPAPQTEPNQGLDDSGDAHRVSPYVQQPNRFSVVPQAQSVSPNQCTPAITATLLDQLDQPIAQANVDLHAVGPSDQLRFGVLDNNATSPFKQPDKGHLSSEFAVGCTDKDNVGMQGEHNVPGGDDVKHVESTDAGGTSNAGTFVFSLFADEAGSTVVTLFADVDDDDTLGASETTGGARIGWGQPAPPPVDQVSLLPASSSPTTGKCQKITLLLTEDGAPLSGRNVDVHATGPGSLQFCDAGTGLPRAPDQGGHVSYADSGGGIHGEAETDSSGHFSFGITSETAGDTALSGWMDRTDDDVQGTDEPSGTGQISWQRTGQRSISLKAGKSTVSTGSKVRLSGRIRGDDGCTDAQVVKLKARPRGRGRFKAAGTTTSDSNGAYRFRKRVKRPTDYRAIAPRDGACVKARSSKVTVRTN
jgi:hypothetical protein